MFFALLQGRPAKGQEKAKEHLDWSLAEVCECREIYEDRASRYFVGIHEFNVLSIVERQCFARESITPRAWKCFW